MLLLFLALAAGCKRETVTYEVSIDVGALPRSATRRLLFRGQDVPTTLDRDGHTLQATFSAAGEQWLSGDVGALRLEITTPCGPLSFGYKSIAPTPEIEGSWVLAEEKKFKPGGAPIKLDFHVGPAPATVLVHVDRREAESAQVALGKQVLERGAGLPRRYTTTPASSQVGDVYEVAAPSACEEGPDVTVGGQKVGRVGAVGLHTHVVIDAKGGHCYDRTEYSYAAPAVAGLPFLRPKHQALSGQRVFLSENGPHREETDEVFAPCPSTSTSLTTCAQVTPVECAGAP